MPGRTTSLKTAAWLAIATIALSGCSLLGDDDAKKGPKTTTSAVTDTSKKPAVPGQPTAAEVFAAADAFFKNAQSMTVGITDPGNRITKSATVSGTVKNVDVHAEMVSAKGGTAAFRSVMGTTYVKGDPAFWTETLNPTAGAAMVKAAKGKYVRSAPAEAKLPVGLNIKAIAGSFEFSSKTTQRLFSDTVEAITHDGKPAFKVANLIDPRSYLIVSATEPRVVLEIGGNPTRMPGTPQMVMRFWDYNTLPEVEPPASREITTL